MALVVVGVSGGVAAFKAASLIRTLTRHGHQVRVIPTPASTEFVGMATWEALSGNPVFTGVFDAGGPDHVEIARHADLIVIAPATADVIARMRAGMANDLLTTTVLATPAPVVIAPAMHTAMWDHPATQDNIASLRQRGVHIIGPTEGALSSGDSGAGRMVEPDEIAAYVFSILEGQASADLSGYTLAITAGGTHEPIDPVRFLGNQSTGRQGIELARASARRGADVHLIAANIEQSLLATLPAQVHIHRVTTALDMHARVFTLLPQVDGLIMAAAVADFRPDTLSQAKIKKTDDHFAPTLSLVQNPDILAEVSASVQRPAALIGFAAETGELETVLEYGRQKAARKRADVLVVNRVGDGHGFGTVNNEVHMMSVDGQVLAHAAGSKAQVSDAILDQVKKILSEKKN